MVPPHAPDVAHTNDCTPVVEINSAKGQHLVLCGAGPSLADHAAEYCPQGDQVWGVNSALPWLHANGHKVTHGFTVDQTPHMCEEWYTTPDVEYLIASTIHPNLLALLVARGRKTRIFHNYVGIKKPPVQSGDSIMSYEDWLYLNMYVGTIRVGSGLNSATRALDVALAMGFSKISVLGADCCLRFKSPPPPDKPNSDPEFRAWLRTETVMHADGGSALASGATAVTYYGHFAGRWWLTKPDMAESARWLHEFEKKYPGRIELIGDTLPVAMRGKSSRLLDRLPRYWMGNGKPIQIILPDMDALTEAEPA
jgi:hypothetical protein